MTPPRFTFSRSEGLESRAIELPRLRRLLGAGGSAAHAWSEAAANSSRWAKLTKESAAMRKKFGLMKDSKTGLEMTTLQIKGVRGGIRGPLRLEPGIGASLLNPANLAGAAGIMSQLAMQQAIADITEYLVTIDKRLDSVLRTQTNLMLARLDGVAFAVEEAVTLRDAVGRVSDVTWSKVQTLSSTILEVQGLALRQLNDIAEGLEREADPKESGVADASTAVNDAKPKPANGSVCLRAASNCTKRSHCSNSTAMPNTRRIYR